MISLEYRKGIVTRIKVLENTKQQRTNIVDNGDEKELQQ